jgi:hypothetical protein
MSVEPHALIRADHACNGQLPSNADLYIPIYDGVLMRLNRAELTPAGRVRVYYTYGGHRHQLTIDGDTMLVGSVQDLSGHNGAPIFRRAGLASSPFHHLHDDRMSYVQEKQSSIESALQGCNFHG